MQMTNTLQSGDIPGMVVDGVPMRGSDARLYDMHSSLSGWLERHAQGEEQHHDLQGR